MSDYRNLITSIQALHDWSARQAASAVNMQLVLRNWGIGAYLVEYEQKGEDRAEYGQGLLARVSRDLAESGIRGTSPDMLERMRLFYRLYPELGEVISAPMARISTALEISAPLVRISVPGEGTRARQVLRLAWTHLVELIRIEEHDKRRFYEEEVINNGWTKRHLQRQIGSLLFERTRLSRDKGPVQEAANGTEKTEHPLAEMIRDPYVFEFLGLREQTQYLESDLENALLDHLQSFLLELGSGFCFEARQKRITLEDEHDHIDLVFYHRILRCHLLIDLKVRGFQHGDAGQMNFYLNWWKAHMVGEMDNPPVGLILCTDRKSARVEYATAGMDQTLFVSRYLVNLPKPEDLERLLEQDRAFLGLDQGVVGILPTGRSVTQA